MLGMVWGSFIFRGEEIERLSKVIMVRVRKFDFRFCVFLVGYGGFS